MKRFTDSIKRSIETQNWYSALSMALAIPDVCGRLVNPNQKSQARYVAWFQKWLEAKYTSTIDAGGTKHVFLCAEDCYALRCSYLHEGGDNILDQRARKALEDFHFITPPDIGSRIHMNQSNSTLQLQVDVFAMDMADAVGEWASSVANDVEIQERIKNLLVIHDSSRGIRF